MPDLPQVLPPANLVSATPIQTGQGAFSPGTYFLKATVFTAYGESLPSPEVSVIIANPNNAISVAFTGGGFTTSLAATKVRIYLGNSTGLQNSFFEFATFNSPQTINFMSDY